MCSSDLCAAADLPALVSRRRVAEWLIADGSELPAGLTLATQRRPDWHFDTDTAALRVAQTLQVHSLDAFGAASVPLGVGAAAAALQYAQDMFASNVKPVQAKLAQSNCPVRGLMVEQADDVLILDEVTLRNLEIVRTFRGDTSPTLASTLDACATSMGSRMLRAWLCAPTRRVALARDRAVTISAIQAQGLATDLSSALKQIPDIERIASRIALQAAKPRELAALRGALAVLPALQALAARIDTPWAQARLAHFQSPPELAGLLAQIDAEPSALVRDGGVFAAGVNAELDHLRSLGAEIGRAVV